MRLSSREMRNASEVCETLETETAEEYCRTESYFGSPEYDSPDADWLRSDNPTAGSEYADNSGVGTFGVCSSRAGSSPRDSDDGCVDDQFVRTDGIDAENGDSEHARSSFDGVRPLFG